MSQSLTDYFVVPTTNEGGSSTAFRELVPDIETAIAHSPDVVETIIDLAVRVEANAIAFRSQVGSRLVRSISGDETIRPVTDTRLPTTALHNAEEVNC